MAEDDDRRPAPPPPASPGTPPTGRGRVLREDSYDVGRLLALSDGVFAIAMTLLVLGIPVPQLTDPTDAGLQNALRHVLPDVGSFALSFVLVGTYWMAHRRLLKGVVSTDAGLVWLNLFMLLLVCMVPFTAALLSRYGSLATAVIIYAANLGLLGLSSLVLRLKSWPLTGVPPSRYERQGAVITSLVGVAVFAISIPIALRSPSLGEYSWLLLLVVGVIFGRRSRNLERRRPRR